MEHNSDMLIIKVTLVAAAEIKFDSELLGISKRISQQKRSNILFSQGGKGNVPLKKFYSFLWKELLFM